MHCMACCVLQVIHVVRIGNHARPRKPGTSAAARGCTGAKKNPSQAIASGQTLQCPCDLLGVCGWMWLVHLQFWRNRLEMAEGANKSGVAILISIPRNRLVFYSPGRVQGAKCPEIPRVQKRKKNRFLLCTSGCPRLLAMQQRSR